MSIYRRKGSRNWQIQFTAPNGRRIQGSSGTSDRKAAQQLHDKLKHEAWQQKHLDFKPYILWEQAVKQWFIDQKSIKRSIERDRWEFRLLDKHLAGVLLKDITRAKITEITNARLSTGVSNATVNRMLALIRAVLNKAQRDWEWLDNVPPIRMLSESNRRIRYLTECEAGRLLDVLPTHLEEMTRFSLATGLREMNVVELSWSNVDIERKCCWVWADEAKGKRSLSVPLNPEAIDVLIRQKGKHETRVFTYRGKPVTRANNHGWKNGLKKAGIVDFRWHDLRHTWASWHVQSGTPLHVLKELGGWKSMEMVLRYAHLSPQHLSQWADNLKVQPLVQTASLQ